MRVAVSAVAATFGLVMLGLGMYGQPAVYLREARAQWDALAHGFSAEADPAPELARVVVAPQRGGAVEHVAVASAVVAPPERPAVGSVVAASGLAPLPSLAPQPEVAALPVPAAADGPGRVEGRSVAVVNTRSGSPVADAVPALAGRVERRPYAPVDVSVVRHEAAPPKAAPARLTAVRGDVAEPVGPKPEAAGRSEGGKPEAARPDLGGQAGWQKLALAKPPSLPVRQDTDDAQSVLARLRQLAPGSVLAKETAAVEPRPAAVQSPLLPELTAARAALANGRVEDARRLLQKVQLQLVFRPVKLASEEAPLAGKGSADIAHALEALSANDVPSSHRYVELAIGDISGIGTSPVIQESQVRPTNGYAPAYPPR